MPTEKNESLAAIAATLARIEQQLGQHFSHPSAQSLASGHCWRWQVTSFGGKLIPLPTPTTVALHDLIGLEENIAIIDKNTRQFIAGCEANHALLTGGRGCGKSTLIRGLFSKYQRRGLRLIETDAAGLAQLSMLQPLLAGREEKYILYCDDLSFRESDQLFNRIKSAMDGALTSASNMLIYATSNRRNLVAEKYSDNLSPLTASEDDIQPLETLDEKIALSDRFGIWLSFYAPDAEHYDHIVRHWLAHFKIKPTDVLIQQARNFADQRGSRNGRIARQFAVLQIKR
ncbi:MAG: ATP-binding protein [Proteobacteria bacterium]|nr:ATP-binding protein [Pseudomonadota bacterium]